MNRIVPLIEKPHKQIDRNRDLPQWPRSLECFWWFHCVSRTMASVACCTSVQLSGFLRMLFRSSNQSHSGMYQSAPGIRIPHRPNLHLSKILERVIFCHNESDSVVGLPFGFLVVDAIFTCMSRIREIIQSQLVSDGQLDWYRWVWS